jgi:flagellar motor switch protein FliN/FliY
MDANPQPMIPADFDEIDTALPNPQGGAAISETTDRAATPADPPTDPPADPPADPPSMAAVFDVPVKVQAILGGAKISINDLLNTRAGTVIELDRRVGEPVDVLVNGRLLARGELVLIDGALGVTLTEIAKPER